MTTLVDLYRKTLEKLGVVASGTPADADDVRLVREKYQNLYEMLETEDLVNWTSDADIPDFATQPLIAMLAFMNAAEFGKDPAAYAAEGALFSPVPSLAERQLRRSMTSKYISTPAQSEYF